MKAIFYILTGIFIGIIMAGLLYLVTRQPAGTPVVLLPAATSAPLTVQVTGNVMHPGLYTLSPGSRVADAVAAAGGLLDDAGAGEVNLAASLKDGQKIQVPAPGVESFTQAESGSPAVQPVYPLDLNTASAEELETLPGIGPTLAKAIVTYREEHGDFATLKDLLDVPGIGDGKFEAIKDLLVVSGSP